jgi:hypothetical protein
VEKLRPVKTKNSCCHASWAASIIKSCWLVYSTIATGWQDGKNKKLICDSNTHLLVVWTLERSTIGYSITRTHQRCMIRNEIISKDDLKQKYYNKNSENYYLNL